MLTFMSMGSPTTSSSTRARLIGRVEWLCPSCIHLNASNVIRGTWRVRCSGPTCRRWFGLGLVFYDLTPLKTQGLPVEVPEDYVFPRVTVETVELPVKRLHQVKTHAG